MIKHFQQVEDVLADETFLGWYFKADAGQVSTWENWLAANPHQQALVNEAIELMNSLPKQQLTASTAEIETKLAQLNQRIDESETPVVPMRSTRKRWWIGAAAAIILLAGAFTFFQLGQSKPAIDTTFGEVRSNQLPDGSTMILNANSTAQLSEGWDNEKDREVWLNGEAFFKVTRTPKRSRFIVHAGNLDVIVTGTQFNVQHRDNKTTVLLTEGSVTIRTKDGKELAMRPGDFVEMNDQLVQQKSAREENVLAWKDNLMAFDNTSLTDIARIISNHYGVKVTIQGNLAATTEPLTGIMPNNNLEGLLKALEEAASIQITRSDKEIIFAANK
jgi:transmembrane sensor